MSDEATTRVVLDRLHTGKTPITSERREVLTQYITTAEHLVTHYAGTAWITVPESIQIHVITLVARELETRDKSPGGVFAAFGEHDGGIRLARDPLTLAYPLLKPYLQGGFA